MESVEFQSECSSPSQQVLLDSERSFSPILTDAEVADVLAVGREWVRSHAEEIPGFHRFGMYYRFYRLPFQQWTGGTGRLLLPDEVASLLKIPKSWVYANADQIPGLLRLGRYVRFQPGSIRTMLRGSGVAQRQGPGVDRGPTMGGAGAAKETRSAEAG